MKKAAYFSLIVCVEDSGPVLFSSTLEKRLSQFFLRFVLNFFFFCFSQKQQKKKKNYFEKVKKKTYYQNIDKTSNKT